MKNPLENFQEQSSKMEVSPTIQNILDGKAKITYIKDDVESRNVDGYEYIGHYYMYKLEMPSSVKGGEVWETYLTIWSPNQISKKDYVKLPEMQITINTGQGEMPIAGKQEVVNKIYDEISRQMSVKE